MSDQVSVDLEIVKTQMKAAWIAALLSFFVPGLGFFYSGSIGKGITFFIFAILCWFGTILIFPAFIGFLLWVVGMVWSYKDVNLYNETLLKNFKKTLPHQ